MTESKRISAALSLDGLGNDARAAFDLAADAGYAAIAFATNQSELTPQDLTPSARRHLQRVLESKGLRIAALRIAGPRGGLMDSASVERTIDNARKGIALAYDLGIPTIAVNAGPLDLQATDNAAVRAAAQVIAEEADRAGLTVAFSAGSHEPLTELIKHVSYDHAKANLETAREIAAGEDPADAAEKLQGGLAQVTLADAIQAGRRARIVELGQGQLPLARLLRTLRETGYRGPLVVDVRDLPDGIRGAMAAAELLKHIL